MENGTEVDDLAGLGKAAEKLIGEISKGIGTLYRPRAIRNEGKAEAAKILAIELAKAQAEEQTKDLAIAGHLNRVALLTNNDPGIVERAKARLLLQEIQGQLNVEAIAEKAIAHLPETVSDEQLSDEWRQRFFKYAADVSTDEMREIWAKILAGEVAQPKSCAARTLDVLHNLSQREAGAFGRLAAISFKAPFQGPVKISDEHSAFGSFGVSYDDLLILRDAGLLSYVDNVRMRFLPHASILFVFHDTVLNLEPAPGPRDFLYYPLTQAGVDLLRVVKVEGNCAYLKQVLGEWLQAGNKPIVFAGPDEIKACVHSADQSKR